MIDRCIVTSTIAATDTRGTRVSATCGARRITVPYNHSVSPNQNHIDVAAVLVAMISLPTEGWTQMDHPQHPMSQMFVRGGEPVSLAVSTGLEQEAAS